MRLAISEDALFEHFKECGEIENVRLIRDNKTGIGKGIGYVAFKTSDAISLAIKLNHSEIEGRKIRVERCSKKQKKKKIGNNSQGNNKNNPRKNNNDSSQNEKKTVNKKFNKEKKKSNKKFTKKNPLKMIKTNKRPSNTFKL